jgi:hypothetical protein
MSNPSGQNDGDFDGRLGLQFRGSVMTSDAGLLNCRELDDALGLTGMANEVLAEARTGKNGRHGSAGLASRLWSARRLRRRSPSGKSRLGRYLSRFPHELR